MDYQEDGERCAVNVVSVGTRTNGSLLFVEDEGARPNPGAPGKKRKKIYIPVDEYRDINFIGALAVTTY